MHYSYRQFQRKQTSTFLQEDRATLVAGRSTYSVVLGSVGELELDVG